MSAETKAKFTAQLQAKSDKEREEAMRADQEKRDKYMKGLLVLLYAVSTTIAETAVLSANPFASSLDVGESAAEASATAAPQPRVPLLPTPPEFAARLGLGATSTPLLVPASGSGSGSGSAPSLAEPASSSSSAAAVSPLEMEDEQEDAESDSPRHEDEIADEN